LRAQDQVTVSFPKPKAYDVVPQPVDFAIVAEEPDFLVINKPAGLVVHPPSKDSQVVTLVHGLLYRFGELAQFTDEQRPGIVHRLDKDTSGLMIVARTLPAHAHLTARFKDRAIHKTYLGVVHGHPPREGSIDYPIARCAHDPMRMTHLDRSGKHALTHYRVLKYYQEYALVEMQPITGRTHQIRVHFAAIGHPLIGDGVYGTSSKFIKRHALHAWKLSFTYKDIDYSFAQYVPQDFSHLLKTLS
jgi:23S rRNA pseudouridine1911/1915/1917 synthase